MIGLTLLLPSIAGTVYGTSSRQQSRNCGWIADQSSRIFIQKKAKRPVQLEVTEQTKTALWALFPSVRRTGASFRFLPGADGVDVASNMKERQFR